MAYHWLDDPFYQKKQIHITWVMIWNGSTEKSWWIPEHYRGIQAYVDGKYQSIDWNNPIHLEEYFNQIKAAGIDVIASDLTNGLGWRRQTLQLQKLCQRHGMKICVAINHHGNLSEYEAISNEIWNTYANPEGEMGSSYFYKDGRPLVVDYCWQEDFEAISAAEPRYGNRFSHVWASGENACKDKWGWQVEPQSGFIPSENTMFITPSICYDSPRTSERLWRRSLSWMDYGFLTAMEADPKYLIAGSFDDVHERNGWFICDTRHASPSWQMRDVTGAISTDVYYNRVKEWLQTGMAQPFFKGGSLADGVYQIISQNHGAFFAPRENRYQLSPYRVKVPDSELDSYYWFYHLGNDEYRIIKLNSGFSIEPSDERDGSILHQNYDSESYLQRWKIEKTDRGYHLINKTYKKLITLAPSGDIVVSARQDENCNQEWLIKAIKTL